MTIMTTIILESIDSHIWNLEYKLIEILKPLLNNEEIMIDLNWEGPCAESLGLFSLLDKLCEEFAIDKNLIHIVTANAIETKRKYKIINSSVVYLTNYNDLNFEPNKSIKKHFGIFIGRSNFNRLYLSAYLYKHHREKTLQTFHFSKNSYLKTGFDQLNTFDSDVRKNTKLIKDFLLNYPFKVEEIESYPILSPAHMNIIKHYDNIFVDIVCETFFTGNTFYPTEKIVRPLLSKTPFLIFGPVNYLSNLRKLGFKTFNDYWSEDYDSYEGIKRCNIIAERIDYISRLSLQQLNDMYCDMKPLLEHNKEVIKSITFENFYKTFENV